MNGEFIKILNEFITLIILIILGYLLCGAKRTHILIDI